MIGSFVLGSLLLLGFLVWESRAEQPMLPLTFFRNRAFSAGNAASFFLTAALFGAVFFLAQFMQAVLGYGPLKAGLQLLPWTATLFLVAPIAGRLVDKFGERPFVATGLTLQAIGMLWIAQVADPTVQYHELVAPLVVAGCGVSMAMPATQSASIGALPQQAVGIASGIFSMMRQLGGVVGVAVLAAVFAAARRMVPSALGAPGNDPDEIVGQAPEVSWLEPFPDLLLNADPASVVGTRQSLRLAMVAALQHLPPRQRAVLILRDVLAWQASEVAELLGTSTAAVNSSLQRARAELTKLAPAEEELSEPAEPVRRALLDQYATAFEKADLVALEGLLTQDTRWEMPPIPTWFDGRVDVLRLLAAKLPKGEGKRLVVETTANGQPAFALYIRGRDGGFHAHDVQVLTVSKTGISAVLAFHLPALFPAFGLPISRPAD
ncbi:RNA polymerase subunit sigma-70 [Kribbella alba]|uniref:RNA polymerase subunit sigma-70 n=1 Tax=Kribbella alba TaxID=190197 RepID=UPI0031E417A1